MNQIFSDILEGISASLRHAANGNYEVLAMIAIVVILAAFLLLRK